MLITFNFRKMHGTECFLKMTPERMGRQVSVSHVQCSCARDTLHHIAARHNTRRADHPCCLVAVTEHFALQALRQVQQQVSGCLLLLGRVVQDGTREMCRPASPPSCGTPSMCAHASWAYDWAAGHGLRDTNWNKIVERVGGITQHVCPPGPLHTGLPGGRCGCRRRRTPRRPGRCPRRWR